MRVGGDLFLSLGPGRDLLALVVVDLVSLGLNRSKKRFVTFVQQRFLILGKVVLHLLGKNLP